MKKLIIILLLLLTISSYSQKTVIIDNYKPYFWYSANVYTADTTYKEINIRLKDTFDDLKDSVKFIFQSLYGHEYDTTLIFNWHKRKYRIDLANINYPQFTKKNLFEFFKSSDTSKIILEFHHFYPGCDSDTNTERITIFKIDDLLIGVYHNPENYDGEDYSTLRKNKRFTYDFIDQLIIYENTGKEKNELCFSGFIHQDCGLTKIIFEDKITYFTNDLSIWDGYKTITRLIEKLEDYKTKK